MVMYSKYVDINIQYESKVGNIMERISGFFSGIANVLTGALIVTLWLNDMPWWICTTPAIIFLLFSVHINQLSKIKQ